MVRYWINPTGAQFYILKSLVNSTLPFFVSFCAPHTELLFIHQTNSKLAFSYLNLGDFMKKLSLLLTLLTFLSTSFAQESEFQQIPPLPKASNYITDFDLDKTQNDSLVLSGKTVTLNLEKTDKVFINILSMRKKSGCGTKGDISFGDGVIMEHEDNGITKISHNITFRFERLNSEWCSIMGKATKDFLVSGFFSVTITPGVTTKITLPHYVDIIQIKKSLEYSDRLEEIHVRSCRVGDRCELFDGI